MKKQITKQTKDGVLKISISTDGINKPYFSITASINYIDGGSAGGCLHDEILDAAPELKPLVDIHLSDLDGVPMYAEANGWCWLAKAAGIPQRYEPTQSEKECFQLFCSHARLSSEEAQEIVDHVNRNPARGREVWGKYVDGLRPVWHDQAQQAIKLIESL